MYQDVIGSHDDLTIKSKLSSALLSGVNEERQKLFFESIIEKSPMRFLDAMGLELALSVYTQAWNMYAVAEYPQVWVQESYIPFQNTPRLFLLAINQDKPFLVDTIQGVCKHLHLTIEHIAHPIVTASDDQKISIIMVQLYPHKDYNINELDVLIKQRLSYVSCATADLVPMKQKIEDASRTLDEIYQYLGDSNLLETKTYLEWIKDNKIVFMGYRYYENFEPEETEANFLCLTEQTSKRLGLFHFEEIRDEENLTPGFSKATSNPRGGEQQENYFFQVNKTNFRAPFHRSSRLDSFEILDFSAEEDALKIKGLHQFVGIFTKSSFQDSLTNIPFIRNKVERAFKAFQLQPDWHDGKRLTSILNSIPHDELFHLDPKAILALSQRILYEMGETVVTSIRIDPYGEHISVIIFVPIEKYHSDLQERFGGELIRSFNGKIGSQHVLLGNLPFVRFIYVIELEGKKAENFNQGELEKKLNQLSLRWDDFLLDELKNIYQEKEGMMLYQKYSAILPSHYKDQTLPENAGKDIFFIEQVKHTKEFQMYFYEERSLEDEYSSLKLKIFSYGRPLSLSFLLPTFKNLGIEIDTEISFCFETDDRSIWLHDLSVVPTDAVFKDSKLRKKLASEITLLLQKIYIGDIRNDGLNNLIVNAHLSAREVTLIRAFAKYLKQVNVNYSFETIINALNTYPDIAGDFVNLFKIRFSIDDSFQSPETYQNAVNAIHRKFQNVQRLDHDAILRRYLNLIQSIIRTNFYQTDLHNAPKNYISFKVQSDAIFDMPLPKPLYEIFVYSAHMEGVHLRGDKVARGGIRWSDRFDDFRQEILALMKAQMVKNAIIVPLGSKGGFVVTATKSNPEEMKKEVIEAYKTFMRGLLDLTDNIKKKSVVTPARLVKYDQEDPYLVVAADKGTATFSDIANSLSKEYDYWLGDAFASGGSNGYDHKKMGITAKGAWESVKHHFANQRIDLSNSSISVIGVGDMSGDVFGNGMLLSQRIKLIGAFNHQSIFIDPYPDPAKSYEERKRLFDLPQSTWEDYNKAFISSGGGVFSRTQKSIPVSVEMKKVFGISMDTVNPIQLIQLLLKSPCDLLWLGGVGTYVKASTEQHYEVRDRQNDEVRINAKDLKAKVVGEGANLGFTQKARIEYALNNGMINTDAIDNSAGVSCSDHEVNLKIFFQSNTVDEATRNATLEKMTDEVEQKVLKDNKDQNACLTYLENAPISPIIYDQLIQMLRTDVGLNTDIEYLPMPSQLLERKQFFTDKKGVLLRPELSVLLAYTKIHLYKDILKNIEMIDWEVYTQNYNSYFPKSLQQNYKEQLSNHPLNHEITATVVSNEFLNYFGIFFPHKMSWITGHPIHRIVNLFYKINHHLGLSFEKLVTGSSQQKEQDIETLGNLLLSYTWTGLQTDSIVDTYLTQISKEKNIEMTPRNLMFMFEAYFHCKNETSNITADHLLNIYHQIQELENDIKFMSLIKKFVDYDIDAYWKWIALQNYLKDLWEMKFQMIRLGKQSNPYRAYKEVIKKAMAEENVDVGYVGYLIHQIKNLQEGR